MTLLNIDITAYKENLIQVLKACYQDGFMGSEHQIPHLAPTYSGILAAMELEAYDFIDRERLLKFFFSLKQEDNSFIMHENGETDLRATYIVVCVSSLLNIMTDELIEGVADYILSCQTYEGGFSAVPGAEAHGGYTFCGFAALSILKQTHKVNL